MEYVILQQGAVLGVAAVTPPPLLWSAGHGGGADQDEERAGAQGDGGALQRGHGPHAAAGEEAQANRQYGSLVNAILLDICSFPDYSMFLMRLNLSGQESSDLIWCWLCCLPCWI